MGAVRDGLRQLCDGENLNGEQIVACIKEIMSADATPAQVAAFLVALQQKPYTPEAIHHAASAMATFSLPCTVPGWTGPIVDIVGTGGDAFDTFNVSTASGIVVSASAPGQILVAKHGNRSSSGKCGSADLVEGLGAELRMDPTQTASVLGECGFAFLFAQMFHPSMGKVAPIRKEIGVRTIFNILGPLTNPARPTHMCVGVGKPELGPLYAEVLKLQSNVKRAVVVHSDDGLDEFSPAVESSVWIVDAGVITACRMSADDFGLPRHPLLSVAGGLPAENAATFRRVLAGEEGPVTDYLLLNSAAALFTAGIVDDWKAGVTLARETIKSGKAAALLEKYIAATLAVTKA